MQPELATQLTEVFQASQEAITLVDALYLHSYLDEARTLIETAWEYKEEIGGILLALAFSKKVRQQIHHRDRERSVLSGKTEHLECAHINHDKSSEEYDTPDNGRLLTTGEHFWDHVNRHGRNGLSESANNWAILMLWKRFWGGDGE